MGCPPDSANERVLAMYAEGSWIEFQQGHVFDQMEKLLLHYSVIAVMKFQVKYMIMKFSFSRELVKRFK